jgi:Histidine kinase-like ATPase domain
MWYMGGSETTRDTRTMTTQHADLATPPTSLSIPCRPEYVALCRLVVGALGARDSLDEEVVADLKVIVTEACNCVLAVAGGRAVAGASGRGAAEDAAAPGFSIRVDFDSRPDAFVISVLYPERRALVGWLEGCDLLSEPGLGLTILKALTDEIAEFDGEAEGTVLRLTKLLPA